MHGRFKRISWHGLFQPKSSSILGIDISTSDVKLLEISGVKGALCVEHYGREEFPFQAMDGNFIKEIDALALSIKKLISRLGTQCRQVALAVPDAVVISKQIQVNHIVNEYELEEFISTDADKYIPFPLHELSLDFESIGPSVNNPNNLEVLLVAARAEIVTNRVAAMIRSGLNAKIVDVASLAVERALQLFVKEFSVYPCVAVIDLGTNSIHLFVFAKMKLIYFKEEQIIGNKASTEHLLLQIKRSLRFYCSSNHSQSIDYILLAGAFAQSFDLDVLVQKNLKIPTAIINPFSGMQLGKNLDTASLYKDAPLLMVACGLALRNIDI